MTPGQARVFQAVAVEGSFTAAAKALGVTQPTITTQVKQIEARYKVELFHRSRRGVRLSPVGAELLTFVRRMFGSYDEAIAYLQEAQGLRQGTLRIGSYGPYGVIPMMARYRERYPRISLAITFANSSDLALRMSQYDLDVALMTSIAHHPEFHVLPFSRPPMVVIAPRTGRWKRQRSLSRDELLKQTLICREPGSAVRAAFDQYLGAHRPPPDRLIEISSREGVVGAVAEGLGLGMIFDEGILPESRVVKVRIRGMDVRSKVDVVCLSERRRSPLIAGFLSVAGEIAEEITGGTRRAGQSSGAA
jgi:aminoethylphosphonate catabolism LysR family transcriptional regulator